jgi:hypothetical protein
MFTDLSDIDQPEYPEAAQPGGSTRVPPPYWGVPPRPQPLLPLDVVHSRELFDDTGPRLPPVEAPKPPEPHMGREWLGTLLRGLAIGTASLGGHTGLAQQMLAHDIKSREQRRQTRETGVALSKAIGEANKLALMGEYGEALSKLWDVSALPELRPEQQRLIQQLHGKIRNLAETQEVGQLQTRADQLAAKGQWEDAAELVSLGYPMISDPKNRAILSVMARKFQENAEKHRVSKGLAVMIPDAAAELDPTLKALKENLTSGRTLMTAPQVQAFIARGLPKTTLVKNDDGGQDLMLIDPQGRVLSQQRLTRNARQEFDPSIRVHLDRLGADLGVNWWDLKDQDPVAYQQLVDRAFAAKIAWDEQQQQIKALGRKGRDGIPLSKEHALIARRLGYDASFTTYNQLDDAQARRLSTTAEQDRLRRVYGEAVKRREAKLDSLVDDPRVAANLYNPQTGQRAVSAAYRDVIEGKVSYLDNEEVRQWEQMSTSMDKMRRAFKILKERAAQDGGGTNILTAGSLMAKYALATDPDLVWARDQLTASRVELAAIANRGRPSDKDAWATAAILPKWTDTIDVIERKWLAFERQFAIQQAILFKQPIDASKAAFNTRAFAKDAGLNDAEFDQIVKGGPPTVGSAPMPR